MPERTRQKSFYQALALLMAALFLLNACNFRESAETPTSGGFSEPERTAAAQTIVAQLTKVSLPTVDQTALALTPTITPAPPTETPILPEPAQLTLTAFASETAAAGTLEAIGVQEPSEIAATPMEEVEATATPEGEASPTEQAASDEGTPEPATPTAEPTQTPVPGDPAADLGQPDWEDDFSTGANWAFYSDDFASFSLQNGALRMTALQKGARNSWMLAVPRPEDYYLEVTARTGDCSGLDRYGVIFRSDANVGYLFGISCNGQFSLRRWNGTRTLVLVDWTSDPAIISGSNQTNRLGLRVEGGSFSLYANGKLLTEISDFSLSETGFGLFIGAETTEDFEVIVERVAYWELP